MHLYNKNIQFQYHMFLPCSHITLPVALPTHSPIPSYSNILFILFWGLEMVQDPKASHFRSLRNVLFIILCITFAIGTWRILNDTTHKDIPNAEKTFTEEQNIEK